MPKAWKIVALTKRKGDEVPMKEYFVVAVPDQFAAMAALRARRPDLKNVDLLLKGEATRGYTQWLDLQNGQILSIALLP
jgi:hypothetical protein